MTIIEELNNRGIEIIKTDDFFIGYYNTEVGTVVSRKEDKCEKGIYFLKNSKFTYPCRDETVYITKGTEYEGEGKIKTKEEAQKLAEEGKIFSFKSSALYVEYYGFDKDRELECAFKHKYSCRSRQYIEAVMKDIGLLKYTDMSNGSGLPEGKPEELDWERNYQIYGGNAGTKAGKLSNGNWLVQTCVQIEIDDFAVIKMHFDHLPTDKQVRTAFDIREFEMRPIEVFTCRECGKITHWLDTQGSLREKHLKAEDKYCGC